MVAQRRSAIETGRVDRAADLVERKPELAVKQDLLQPEQLLAAI